MEWNALTTDLILDPDNLLFLLTQLIPNFGSVPDSVPHCLRVYDPATMLLRGFLAHPSVCTAVCNHSPAMRCEFLLQACQKLNPAIHSSPVAQAE